MLTTRTLTRCARLTGVALLLIFAGWTAHGQDGVQQFADLGRCQLDSGQMIEDCKIGYRTFGHLNDKRDNAVLFLTWYGGTSANLQEFFGPDKMVDTARFYAIAIDALGNGVSSSPSNSTRQHGVAFPEFTVDDIVHAAYRAVTEKLHLKKAHAVMGMSMGGIQTFSWVVSYPSFADLAVPLVGSPQLTSFDLLYMQATLDAILSDPAYQDGKYVKEPPLALANELSVMLLTTPEYRVEHTTRGQYEAFLALSRDGDHPDANDRVWQLRAVMKQDVLKGRTMADVARSSQTKFLIVASAQDHMVNPAPALAWAAAAGAPTFVSHANCGHFIYFGCDREEIVEAVRSFLRGSQP